MSNDSKNFVKPGQLSLFEIIQKQKNNKINNLGGLNIVSEFNQIISRCISRSNLSRYQITSQMSELLNQEITVNMLNGWTADSHDQHRFPAVFLPAFCQVVKSYEPIQFLAEKMGLFLLPGEEALRSEIQKLEENINELTKEKEKRLYFLSEIENNGKE